MALNTLVLDLERVADPAALANHRDVLIAMATKRDRFSDKPQTAEEFAALCPPLARVVAAALHNPETGWTGVIYDSVACGYCPPLDGIDLEPQRSERALLAALADHLRRYFRLVTFAGRRYDLPVIVHRSRINGLPVPPLVTLSLNQKPWDDKPHTDLREAFSFGGATDRHALRAYAIAYGFADPKATGDGAQVAELVRAGRAEELVTYAAGDVRVTADLWRAWTTTREAESVDGQPPLFEKTA